MNALRRAALILLMVTLSIAAGCSSKAPAGEPAPPGKVVVPVTAGPVLHEPRLVLDLALANAPDLPGMSPGRVGGVGPAGPRSLAVGPEQEIYLLDHAHARLLRYSKNGKFHSYLPLPWLGEWSYALYRTADRFYLKSGHGEIVMDPDGRILNLRRMNDPDTPTLYPVTRVDQPYVPLGSVIGLGDGLLYERTETANGVYLRRTGANGRELDLVRDLLEGDSVDYHVSPAGGVYILQWVWEEQEIRRMRVFEMIPPLNSPAGGKSAEPAPAPVAFGLPVPRSIQVMLPDWQPFTLNDPVDLHNLWMLLSRAFKYDGSSEHGLPPIRLTATFPGGSTRSFSLSAGLADVDGQVYSVSDAAHRMLYHLGFSPEAVRQVLATAALSVSIDDLPGQSRPLSEAERRQLAEALEGSGQTAAHSMPHPLEAPFPRYSLQVAGEGWQGSIELHGAQHLALANTTALYHAGKAAELVGTWLPLPAARAGELAYLYQASELDMNGHDLTRWKATVVRYLLGVTKPYPGNEGVFKGELTFTFLVDGKAHVVQVGDTGFAYAGRWYVRSGLTQLAGLAGVP